MAVNYTLPLQDYISEQDEIAFSYSTISVKFGDGYEQTADDGINNEHQTWSVTYHALAPTQYNTLRTFLSTVRGTVPFYATPRGDTKQVWRLDPASLKVQTLAVSNLTSEAYKTVTFNLKKAYL